MNKNKLSIDLLLIIIDYYNFKLSNFFYRSLRLILKSLCIKLIIDISFFVELFICIILKFPFVFQDQALQSF